MLMTPSPLTSFASRVNFLPLAWVLASIMQQVSGSDRFQ